MSLTQFKASKHNFDEHNILNTWFTSKEFVISKLKQFILDIIMTHF